MKPDRSWMYKRLDGKYISSKFVEGVKEFVELASQKESFKKNKTLKCPCTECKNVYAKDSDTVKLHLYKYGFVPNYTRWICHGEKLHDSATPTNESSTSNPYHEMILDAMGPRDEDRGEAAQCIKGEAPEHIEEEPNPEAKKFFDMLKRAEEPLYEGCKLSVLAAASRLTNIKCEYNIPHRAIDGIASLMRDMCPTENKMTNSYSETKNLLEGLELPHQKIHACPNGCMLFWKDDECLRECRICHAKRYKKNKVPNKVLTYFPITPRLQRLYATKGIAEQMRWHSENSRTDGSMAHPCDGEAWKTFDKEFEEFSSEPRNVRLGLCTDGFSPFGRFGKQYSCWPIILTPYNLPPSLCMKREFMFLSLIVPGPENPKGNLDVYMQPLIEELKHLWETGALTYDISSKQAENLKPNFTMKAALMWTISDFPAYGMLSGWSTGGRLACPYCMEKTKAFYLKHGSKVCWFDCHRPFLPHDHKFRKNRSAFFKNRVELSEAPTRLSGEEIRERVSNLPKATDPNFATEYKKMKKGMKNSGWKRQSIFWELPYWSKLLIRHNLDVMHIEKNVFDQVMNTVMEVKGKTKDTTKARKDLPNTCKRRKLHLEGEDGNDGEVMPKADYVLTKEQKQVLCEWVQNLKFPDGFASNLSRCVDMKQHKLSGMKSHDCHVFMERLIPVALRELLPHNVWTALTELSQFFKNICSSDLQVEDMAALEKSIPIILCKLEKIFPPGFFNSMEHLPIHLPYEAKVGGPVHYRWMYPFERFLHHLKRKVGNKAHVEGSICQAYLVEEISNFCTSYFEPHVDTKARDLGRNVGLDSRKDMDLPEVFSDFGGYAPRKGQTTYLDDRDYRAAHAYVLSNCAKLGEMETIFKQEMIQVHPRINPSDMWTKFGHEFPSWLKQYVSRSRITDDLIKALAQGPSRQVQTWKHYYINGFNFHTYAYGKDKTTMNYGVCVKSQEGVEYYGILQDVVELVYYGNKRSYRTILFKCDWMDPGKGTKIHKEYKLVEVNHTMRYPSYDPYVLAFQSPCQVYFAPYPSTTKEKDKWRAVFKIKARSTIDFPAEKVAFQEEMNENVALCEVEEEPDIGNHWDEEDADIEMEVEHEHEGEFDTTDDDDDDFGDDYDDSDEDEGNEDNHNGDESEEDD